MLAYAPLPSPIGPLTVVASPTAVTAIYFPGEAAPAGAAARAPADHPVLAAAAAELAAYFAGALRRFALPLAGIGTPFQQQVWRALGQVPFGATTSYGALAAAVGRPTAARAIGAANGANPIPIVVPCHRVIGADGSLTGYAGGVAIKRWLLAHEAGARPAPLR
ncbi:MAG: methylated-DNA--[protein]-cysteine S-methyltransferase [Kofleriaceae bacterium]